MKIKTFPKNQQRKRTLNQVCNEVLGRLVERGTVPPDHRRNRHRYFEEHFIKHLPRTVYQQPNRLSRAVTLLLAVGGLGGFALPQQVTAEAVFKHRILAGFDVGGQSNPSFVDIDNDGDLDAFVGEEHGTVRYYRNTGTTSAPVFVADVAGNPLAEVDVNDSAAPSFADIDNDGDLDVFVGEVFGKIRFYRNTGTAAAPVFVLDVAGNPLAGVDVGPFATQSFANPSFADIDNDGDLDVFVGEYYGKVKFFRNTGTASAPVFVADAAGNPLAGIDVGRVAAPSFADIDNDGDLDAFVGAFLGAVRFFRNTGTASTPVFVVDAAGNPLAGIDFGYFAIPRFADLDNDGDLDAFVGNDRGTVMFYRNTGTASTPVLVADATGNPLGVDVGARAAPSIADIDNDGDLDAFVGEHSGSVSFYRNTGTTSAPVFVADAVGSPLAGFGVGEEAKPSFADIDNDGDLDVFIGARNGRIEFFQNVDPGFGTVGTTLLIGLGPHQSNGGWLDAVNTAPPHALKSWLNLNWPAYNAANGETRPVFCDVDGDGLKEVVIGLGTYPANGGWLEIRDDATTGYAHLAWLNINWNAYNTANGETRPACGDVDNDGLDEIIVGLGTGGQGWLKGFDDAQTGYAALPGTPVSNGWIRSGWGVYNAANGATYPAIGQLDNDSAQELVLGLGNGGHGWIQVLDDADSGFASLPDTPVNNGWLRLNWSAYNAIDGETRPTVCDLNNDGQDEIALGLSSMGQGWLQIVDSATGFAPLTDIPSTGGWVRVDWNAYNTTNGETFPTCGNVDADPADELLIGLGQGGFGWVEIKDDAATGLAHQSWPRVNWSDYDNANGSTHPAVE